jgi:hypothetical protein
MENQFNFVNYDRRKNIDKDVNGKITPKTWQV